MNRKKKSSFRPSRTGYPGIWLRDDSRQGEDIRAATTVVQEPLSKRARRRITRRLIPFLFIVYIICFLDRVNVTYANLEMTRDLNFTSETYGFGAGIFFIGYFVLEIPGTMLVAHLGPSGWLPRIETSGCD